jgi:hypothetical protein
MLEWSTFNSLSFSMHINDVIWHLIGRSCVLCDKGRTTTDFDQTSPVSHAHELNSPHISERIWGRIG